MEGFLIFGLIAGAVYLFSGKEDYSNHPPLKKSLYPKDRLTKKELESLINYENLFDARLGYSLSDGQRKSIVSEAERNLVLASAGSGKTTTLLAKYAYLLESKKAKENEILVLAFARPVVEEIKAKLKKFTKSAAEVETFHSLGLKLLKDNSSQSFKVDEIAKEDGNDVLKTKQMEELARIAQDKDSSFFSNLRNFTIFSEFPQIVHFAKDQKEYMQMISKYPYKKELTRIQEHNKNFARIPSINGKYFLRSQQELSIANYLIINGIEFEYEKDFNLNSAHYVPLSFDEETKEEKPWDSYRPDFYINEADIWYEHFAIDLDTKNSPFEGYVEQHDEKKEFHEKNNTNFFCTYMSDYYKDNLFELIDEMLEKFKVKKNPLSESEINNMMKNIYKNNVLQLLSETIKLYKSSGITKEMCLQRLDSLPDKFRSNRFKKIFFPMLEEYENTLAKNNTIDFDDMIGLSSKEISNSRSYSQLKYILVDEFQDISDKRLSLLESLLEHHSSAKLFAVGDDWQSIYRFTGANISITTKFFEDIFGKIKTTAALKIPKFGQLLFSEDKGYAIVKGLIEKDPKQNDKNENQIVKLKKIFDDEEEIIDHVDNYDLREKRTGLFKIEETYRFGKNISKLSSEFIQRNPNQIKKVIKPKIDTENPIYFCNLEKYETKYLQKVLDKIPKKIGLKGKRESIFFLARNNYQLEGIEKEFLINARPDLEFKFDTIHAAKGAEADIVVLIGLDGGPNGFPRWQEEDPLKSVFLPLNDQFKFSEQRRVLYVGLTRAKHQLFICHEKDESSIFFNECLEVCKELEIPFKRLVYKSSNLYKCPACIGQGRPGALRIKTRKIGRGKNKFVRPKIFLGCNLYNPKYKDDLLFCDYADYDSNVPCPKCLEDAQENFLEVISENNFLYISCKECNFKDSYFNYHK